MKRRTLLYYAGYDGDGEMSVTADEVVTDDALDSIDTGLVDADGQPIKRQIRASLGFFVR